MQDKNKKNYGLPDFIKQEAPLLSFVDHFFRSEPIQHFLNEFNQLVQQSFAFPLLNIETAVEDNQITVEAAMPGLSKENFEAEIFDRYLNLNVIHKEESQLIHENKAYYQNTASLSNFSKSVLLPYPVDEDGMQILFLKDTAIITIPRKK
ncbi:Hsp20/alpha crystallin family protein [Metabacillus sp. GX 13764]|uniref:Hsp20/alpha crystallin family protein n=1 Tax=Metabacillus kandeliae TaxID=2900151 RepID=UPI001E3E9BA6|nr:Hsp20/alpha crystallin family protein [Metabacillus kandeliae]MCD7033412.1 Hsp20/alpha crystallin family protein [Metabacillus kandeliae]